MFLLKAQTKREDGRSSETSLINQLKPAPEEESLNLTEEYVRRSMLSSRRAAVNHQRKDQCENPADGFSMCEVLLTGSDRMVYSDIISPFVKCSKLRVCRENAPSCRKKRCLHLRNANRPEDDEITVSHKTTDMKHNTVDYNMALC